MVEKGQGQFQLCTLWAHAMTDRQHQSALPVDSSCGGVTQRLLSQWEHSSPAFLMPQLWHGSGDFYSNPWGAALFPAGLWEPQSQEAALLSIHWKLWSQHQSHPHQGANGQHGLRRPDRHLYWKSPHPKYQTHAGHPGMLLRKISPPRPQ